MGALRRNVHRPNFKRTHGSRVYHRCATFTNAVVFNLVFCLWGTALEQFTSDGYTGVTETVEAYKPELSLFKMLDELPMTMLISSIAMLLTIIFFVTSSDSGSLVIDTITAGGKLDAPVSHRVFWCTAEGAVAIVLLLGGGLSSLQAASLVTGFPFAVVLLGMAVCVWIGLRNEIKESR